MPKDVSIPQKTTKHTVGHTNFIGFLSSFTTQKIEIPETFRLNERMKMDGLEFLRQFKEDNIVVVFFDPQYRGVLDHLKYGNEGKRRGQARGALPQMTETIPQFIQHIARILRPSGHLFLWVDKFHLCQGIGDWLADTTLDIVDMITWDKGRIGMGYRTRRCSEYVFVIQKRPRRAKGIWRLHTIPDVWRESVPLVKSGHPKPIGLQGELIKAVSQVGDIVMDPAAGSFSVLEACRQHKRHFLGCDIQG